MKAIAAQTRVELALTLRRGESLLVVIGIPAGLLVFFTLFDVLPHPGRAVDFLVPGIIALSMISSAMTNLAIATGFERHAGVLRRLGTTPLGKGGLLVAKLVSLVVIAAIQVAVVVGAAAALGWNLDAQALLQAGAWALLGLIAFASIGFLMAGRLRAETNLAAANGLFLLFLLFGGIVVPLDRLPEQVASIAKLVPAEPLTTLLAAALAAPGSANVTITRPAVTLAVWAIGGTLLAVRAFRWD